MSTVDVKEAVRGDTVTLANINADLQAYVSESEDIDEENLRDRGLDRRNFDTATRPVREVPTGSQLFTQDGATTLSPAPASAPASPQWETGDYDLEYDDNDVAWRAVASFEYAGVSHTTANPVTAGTAVVYSFQMYWSDDGGSTWSAVNGTLRRAGQSAATAGKEDIDSKGSITMSIDLRAIAGSGGGSSTVRIGLAAWEVPASADTGSPDLTVRDIALWIERIKR